MANKKSIALRVYWVLLGALALGFAGHAITDPHRVDLLAPSLLGDQACGLFSVPALTSLAEKQSLRWQDVRRVGDDLRILARLSA